MLSYIKREDKFTALSSDDINTIDFKDGSKIYFCDTKETKIYHNGIWYSYNENTGSGGGSTVIENGSITTEKFSENAKSPYAGIADSANEVSINNINGVSTIGKSVITASSAINIRAAIGAGTGNSNLTVGNTVGSVLGTASAGISEQASRADHVHPAPSPANIGAASASHIHTIENITDLQETLNNKLTATKVSFVAHSTATDIEGVNEVLNNLLDSLVNAGIMV